MENEKRIVSVYKYGRFPNGLSPGGVFDKEITLSEVPEDVRIEC